MENPIRILAVDDSVTIRKALELILVPAGFQVEFAVNGGEAIEKAKQFQPSIVLLDFILPDMRGTEVCRELLAAEQTRHLPVVLISARGAEIRQAYHDVDNVIDYLTKPFTPDAVLGVIREVLAAQPARLAESARIAAAAPTPQVSYAVEPAPEVSALDVGLEPAAPALIPPAPAATPAQSALAAVPSAAEEEVEEVVESAVAAALAPRDGLEAMFETLRAGLEGVYVEEMDTPAGAGVDPARSYTDMASRLAQQLGETLEQAESRRRFRLYGDGSVRSLDESLLETYRRVCRLLFRAVASGAVGEVAVRERPRVLVVCPRESESYELLDGLARDPGEAHVFLISSDFRQLPILARLYGPTHLVVDAGRAGAVWEQLKVVRAMPEARRMQILAVGHGDSGEVAHFSDLGADAILDAGPGLQEAIRCRLLTRGGSGPATSTVAAAAPLAASM